MSLLRRILEALNWPVLLFLCATLGLAPFRPEPHIWEKLKMLGQGDLSRAVDIFDLVLHGLPWVFLLLKLVLARRDSE